MNLTLPESLPQALYGCPIAGLYPYRCCYPTPCPLCPPPPQPPCCGARGPALPSAHEHRRGGWASDQVGHGSVGPPPSSPRSLDTCARRDWLLRSVAHPLRITVAAAPRAFAQPVCFPRPPRLRPRRRGLGARPAFAGRPTRWELCTAAHTPAWHHGEGCGIMGPAAHWGRRGRVARV